MRARREWPLVVMLTERFGAVAAIPIVLLALVYSLHFAPQIRQDVDVRQESLARAILVQVEAYFGVATREVGNLARLLATSAPAGRRLDDLLDAYAAASEFYEAIYLADARGTVAAIGLPAEARARRPNLIGLDFSERDFVRQAHRERRPVWSDTFLSPVSSRVAVALAVPIGEQTLIGEVAVRPLPTLAKRLTEGSDLRVMILDRNDQLVAHSANAYANQQLNLRQLPVVASGRQGDGGRHLPFEFDGEQLIGSARPMPDMGWLVVVAEPRRVAYRQIDAFWWRLAVGLAVSLLAVLAAAGWTARALSERVQIFNEQAQAIADGRYDLPWKASDVVELNRMRDNLHRMADAIHDRETAMREAERNLMHLNATLEERVTARTAELTQSNTELGEALDTLQRAQSELLQAEKLAALGSMVAGVAHELNTPLGNGLMAATTLEDHVRRFSQEVASGSVRRASLDRFVNESLAAGEVLVRNLFRASELVASFKQVAVDQTSSQRRQFMLDELVHEIMVTLQPTLKKTPFVIEVDVAPGLALDSYPGPLWQVLTNLVNNAVLHGLEGFDSGSIRLEARALEGDPGDSQVEIVVADNGRGIAAEVQARIFDPFFTTKLGKGGSGLGMHIVHTLVTRVLGGRIRIDSALGEGTRATLVLPCCAPQPAST